MYGISIDIDVSNEEQKMIDDVLSSHDFIKKHKNFYVSTTDDMTDLMAVIHDLMSLPWFKDSVKNIHAFEVKSLSDFTSYVKGK